MRSVEFSRLFFVIFTTLIIAHTIGAIFFPKIRFGLILVGVILAVVLLLFYRLIVTVNDSKISISFGIGLVHTSFDIKSIKSVQVVKNSPLSGWGIRYNPEYTLYNVGGFRAIELSFKDDSQKIRIGSKEPDKLAAHISTQLQ